MIDRCVYWFVIMLLLPLSGFAGNFEVSPVRLQINAHESVTTLQLRNVSDQPTLLQSSIVKWTQQRGKDVYTNTEELIATPPIVSIQPHEIQLIRVGLIHPVDSREEGAYRIFVKEIAQKVKKSSGLRMVFQLSIPIFIPPENEVASLHWQAHKASPQSLVVKLVNNGNSHIQVTGFKLYTPEAKNPALLLKQSVFNYLLPHQANEWSFKLKRPLTTNSLKLVVSTDKGEIVENITPT